MMKTKHLFPIALIALFAFLPACSKTTAPEQDAVAAELNDYTGLDGCSWVITLQTGEVLEPTNLGDFNIDIYEGNKVWLKYIEETDLASICMVGPIVTIESIWER